MSSGNNLPVQNQKNGEYEYQQTPNTDESHDTHLEYQHKFPSPVLIAMSALNETQDHHKQLYQNDYIREEGFDLEIQCGKLNSQYVRGNRKESDSTQSQGLSVEPENEEQEQPAEKIYNKQLIQKTINVEDIYCNGSVEQLGYFRLVDAKNTLQSMIKYNFPELAFDIVNACNPLERDFFKNSILDTLISINDKVPPRVIEKSKPMICCKNLLDSIRANGYGCVLFTLLAVCLMVANFMYYKHQIGFSISFVICCLISITSILSYYLFFRQLTLFQYHSLYQWTLFFIGISCAYFFIFISGFITGNSLGVQLTSGTLSFIHILLSFLIKEIGTKSIRFLVLVKVIPESELQTKFQLLH